MVSMFNAQVVISVTRIESHLLSLAHILTGLQRFRLTYHQSIEYPVDKARRQLRTCIQQFDHVLGNICINWNPVIANVSI